jgi:hypothetical protein
MVVLSGMVVGNCGLCRGGWVSDIYMSCCTDVIWIEISHTGAFEGFGEGNGHFSDTFDL